MELRSLKQPLWHSGILSRRVGVLIFGHWFEPTGDYPLLFLIFLLFIFSFCNVWYWYGSHLGSAQVRFPWPFLLWTPVAQSPIVARYLVSCLAMSARSTFTFSLRPGSGDCNDAGFFGLSPHPFLNL